MYFDNFHIQFQELLLSLQAIDADIHQTLNLKKIDYVRLFKRLDLSLETLNELAEKNFSLSEFASAQKHETLQDLKKKIIYSYGHLEQKWSSSQLTRLQMKFNKIRRFLAQKPLRRSTADQIKKMTISLQRDLDLFTKNFRLSKEEQCLLKPLFDFIRCPQGEYTFCPISFKDHQKPCFEASEEESIDLLEIAELFYQNKNVKALEFYKSLNLSLRKKIEEKIEIKDIVQNQERLIYSLVKTAYEIMDLPIPLNETRSSFIKNIFEECQKVRKVELLDKDLSFKSIISLTG
ncbi:MAG: hypothetical protein ACOVOR_04380 [Rhabdochlamydiaceae bacterium]